MFGMPGKWKGRVDYSKRPPFPTWFLKCKNKTSKAHWTKIYWATPPWLSDNQYDQMKMIYANRPKGCHVDHIVPLKSPIVCGLNVPWNLQIVLEKINLYKSNNMWPGHPLENKELDLPKMDHHQMRLI